MRFCAVAGLGVLALGAQAESSLTARPEDSQGTANLPLSQDGSFSSAVERLFIAVNGATQGGCDHPQRQGLFAALTDGFRPNNTFGGIPTIALDYSPICDANPFEWTQEAINLGYRSQLREESHILGLVERGFLTGPGGAPFGSVGFVVNCPIVFRLL